MRVGIAVVDSFVYTIKMALSWDPVKAASNLAKHGIAFTMAERLDWETALISATLGHASGEPRFGALGAIDDGLFFMVYSIETRSTRVISLRKANDREKRKYAEIQVD